MTKNIKQEKIPNSLYFMYPFFLLIGLIISINNKFINKLKEKLK
jgi:hypothetical protein